LLLGVATELVRLNVDVIVTYATAVLAAQRATRTIPIVVASYTDAAAGLVGSLAHPGGNITGSTFLQLELMAKRLELLKQVVPSMNRAGVFLFRGAPARARMLETMGATAKALGVELQPTSLTSRRIWKARFQRWPINRSAGSWSRIMHFSLPTLMRSPVSPRAIEFLRFVLRNGLRAVD
jgi:putative ABC transport system substrate-binding protein